jgi:hypothetical protein
VTVKDAVFWHVKLCDSWKIRCSEECIATIIGLKRNRELGTSIPSQRARLLVSANVITSSSIPVTVMMEAIRFCETSVLTGPTRPNVQEDSILHSHGRENLKSCVSLTGWSL